MYLEYEGDYEHANYFWNRTSIQTTISPYLMFNFCIKYNCLYWVNYFTLFYTISPEWLNLKVFYDHRSTSLFNRNLKCFGDGRAVLSNILVTFLVANAVLKSTQFIIIIGFINCPYVSTPRSGQHVRESGTLAPSRIFSCASYRPFVIECKVCSLSKKMISTLHYTITVCCNRTLHSHK